MEGAIDPYVMVNREMFPDHLPLEIRRGNPIEPPDNISIRLQILTHMMIHVCMLTGSIRRHVSELIARSWAYINICAKNKELYMDLGLQPHAHKYTYR